MHLSNNQESGKWSIGVLCLSQYFFHIPRQSFQENWRKQERLEKTTDLLQVNRQTVSH